LKLQALSSNWCTLRRISFGETNLTIGYFLLSPRTLAMTCLCHGVSWLAGSNRQKGKKAPVVVAGAFQLVIAAVICIVVQRLGTEDSLVYFPAGS
jgi:hypothetical protein